MHTDCTGKLYVSQSELDFTGFKWNHICSQPDMRYFRNILAWIRFQRETVCCISVAVETMWTVGWGWGGVVLKGFKASPHINHFNFISPLRPAGCGIDHTDLNLQTYCDCTLQCYRLCVQSWPITEQAPTPFPPSYNSLLDLLPSSATLLQPLLILISSPLITPLSSSLCILRVKKASRGTHHATHFITCDVLYFFLITPWLRFYFYVRTFSRNKICELNS